MTSVRPAVGFLLFFEEWLYPKPENTLHLANLRTLPFKKTEMREKNFV
jgi:hypothetical protein